MFFRMLDAAIKLHILANQITDWRFDYKQQDNSFYVFSKLDGAKEGQYLYISYRIDANGVLLILNMPDCMYDYKLADKKMKKLNSVFVTCAEGDPECKSITIKSDILLETLEDHTEMVLIMMEQMVNVMAKIMNTKKADAS